MFKWDIHMHTSEVSYCAYTDGARMAELFKEKGYDGIVVTDHFVNGSSRIPKDLPWEERIMRQFDGYKAAKKRGDEIGLKVFAGFEYPERRTDFLVYGLYEDFLIKHPEIPELPIEEALTFFRENGGFIIQAHPCRLYLKGSSRGIHLYPQHVDAIEVYNGANGEGWFPPEYNYFAKFYADQTNLPQTAGTDTHREEKMFGGGMLFERQPEDIFDLISMIKAKDFQITTK